MSATELYSQCTKCTFQRRIDLVDIAGRSYARKRQTRAGWAKQSILEQNASMS